MATDKFVSSRHAIRFNLSETTRAAFRVFQAFGISKLLLKRVSWSHCLLQHHSVISLMILLWISIEVDNYDSLPPALCLHGLKEFKSK